MFLVDVEPIYLRLIVVPIVHVLRISGKDFADIYFVERVYTYTLFLLPFTLT